MPKPKPSKKVIQQHLLWPTPYWYTQIWEFMRSETRVTFNDDFIGYILNEAEKKESTIKSNRGGWQSEIVKHNDENYKPLVDEIVEFVRHLNLPIKKFEIKQLWANVNRKNDYNIVHQHGNYDLSGTYYVKVPKNSGRLMFRDPRPGAISNSFMSKNFDKGELHGVNILEGMLVMWPAYLDHLVEPNKTDDERISISFDINVI